jgi:protein tyrosine phosphatase
MPSSFHLIYETDRGHTHGPYGGTLQVSIFSISIFAGTTTGVCTYCSAGCGRTGTLILCDIILKMANHENQVDFPEILRRIRNARIGLVSTVDQYIFAHRVVLEYLFGQDFSIPINEKFESNVDKAVNLKAMNLLVQHLAKAIDQYQRTMFKLHHKLTDEEKAKNRFSQILPGNNTYHLVCSNRMNLRSLASIFTFNCEELIKLHQRRECGLLPLPQKIHINATTHAQHC